MKNLLCGIVGLLCSLQMPLFANNDNQFLKTCIERCKQLKSFRYSVRQGYKFFNSSDTLRYYGKVWAEQSPTEEIPKYIWNTSIGEQRVFDGSTYSLIDSNAKRVIVYDKSYPEVKKIASSFIDNYSARFFLKALGLLNSIHKAKTHVKLNDAIIGGESCIGIEFLFDSDEMMSDIHQIMYISKRDTLPRKLIEYALMKQYGDGYHYSAIEIENFELVAAPQASDFMFKKTSDFRVMSGKEFAIESEKESAKNIAKIKVGDKAPILNAVLLDGKTLEIAKLENSIKVLYFWRMACVPTEKSKPYVVKLAKEFANEKVVFIGLNFVDGDSSQIQKYLAKSPLPFSSAIITSELAGEFGVSGNPELLVIDSKGNIAMHVDGYSKGFTADMKKVILKLLRGMKI